LDSITPEPDSFESATRPAVDLRSLSDEQLLATIGSLRACTAVPDESVSSATCQRIVDLIELLARAEPNRFRIFRGVGRQRAIQLAAAVELGRRGTLPRWRQGTPFTGAAQVYRHCARRLQWQVRECFVALMLDSRNRLRHEEIVSVGSLATSIVHPREVFECAIRTAAASILVVHNHPSGDSRHSEEDVAVTHRLHRCGRLLGIELLDHVVIGRGEWLSMRDEQLGPWHRGGDRMSPVS